VSIPTTDTTKVSWDFVSSFAIDSFPNKLYIATSSVPVRVATIDLEHGSLESFTVAAEGTLVQHLWNLAFWEGGDRLLGVMPNGFSTDVLSIDKASGNATVLASISSGPVRGVYALNRKEGYYFFMAGGQAGSRSIVRVAPWSGSTETWSDPRFIDVASLHWDPAGMAAAEKVKGSALEKRQSDRETERQI
jgi:hypothetical protein